MCLPVDDAYVCVFSLYHVFPARAPNMTVIMENNLLGVDPGDDRHAGTQAGFQLALLGTTLVISIVGGLLTGKASSIGKNI